MIATATATTTTTAATATATTNGEQNSDVTAAEAPDARSCAESAWTGRV